MVKLEGVSIVKLGQLDGKEKYEIIRNKNKSRVSLLLRLKECFELYGDGFIETMFSDLRLFQSENRSKFAETEQKEREKTEEILRQQRAAAEKLKQERESKKYAARQAAKLKAAMDKNKKVKEKVQKAKKKTQSKAIVKI